MFWFLNHCICGALVFKPWCLWVTYSWCCIPERQCSVRAGWRRGTVEGRGQVSEEERADRQLSVLTVPSGASGVCPNSPGSLECLMKASSIFLFFLLNGVGECRNHRDSVLLSIKQLLTPCHCHQVSVWGIRTLFALQRHISALEPGH